MHNMTYPHVYFFHCKSCRNSSQALFLIHDDFFSSYHGKFQLSFEFTHYSCNTTSSWFTSLHFGILGHRLLTVGVIFLILVLATGLSHLLCHTARMEGNWSLYVGWRAVKIRNKYGSSDSIICSLVAVNWHMGGNLTKWDCMTLSST